MAWIIKQKLKGMPSAKLAFAQGISELMLHHIMRIYKEQRFDALKNQKTGCAAIFWINALPELFLKKV